MTMSELSGIRNIILVKTLCFCRHFSLSPSNNHIFSCKILIIGGGSGGITMAAKFARREKNKDSVIVLEPNKKHYYQPFFTLIGAGIVKLKKAVRLEKQVMPRGVIWIQDYARHINPNCCYVDTKQGHTVNYQYLIVAVGLIMNYNRTPGMLESLDDPNSSVSTIYSENYCEKTFSDLKRFQGGEALFLFPKCPVKCPGAPLKMAFLADSFFTKMNRRSKANITYITGGKCLFGVKKYADQLDKVVLRKNLNVEFNIILKEINHERKEAVFYHGGQPECTVTRRYDLLHVVPYQRPPDVIYRNKEINDRHGFLDVSKYTLQHNKFPNIYGIGDCTSTPNSKTAAAIAKQSYVVEHNLLATMNNRFPTQKYNGYGACPLLTSYNTVILAEFIYDNIPFETMPFDQSQESVIAYYMKRHLFPFLYWHAMLKGRYHGPGVIRKIVNPFGW